MTLAFTDLKTQFTELERPIRNRIDKVLEHGQFIMGPEVYELELKLSSYVGSKYCITVSSGTEALLISLMSLNIGPGDEVITTAFSFVATVEVIVLLGATPIFVDVDINTCNIDESLIEDKINSSTKAIIPVSLFGQISNMTEINALAAKHGGIPVIEDAAQSFGAEYQGARSCNLSLIGCTSFFPSKPLGCYGDGGAIFTSDQKIANICRELRVHGQSKRYVHSRVGVGGRMDTIQCAIVLAKLDRFTWEIARRQFLGNRYNKLIDEIGLERVHQNHDTLSVFAQYTILVENRDLIQSRLGEKSVPTAVHYPIPLNQQPAYKHFCCPNCTPVAERLSSRVLSLPMSAYLSEEDQDIVINSLKECI